MSIEEMSRTWLTVGELARALRISRTGAYRLLENRAIGYHIVGGSYRISAEDFQEYLRKARRPARAHIS